MIRVLVADDHPAMRKSLRALIEGADDLELAAEAVRAADAVRLVAEEHPDLVVIALSRGGLEAVREIAELGGRTRIVALTMSQARDSRGIAIEAGAHGLLAKTDVDRDLLPIVRAVAAGERRYPARHRVGDRPTDRRGASPTDTRRQSP